MSRYQEIQQRFHSLREAEVAYWESLEVAQKKLRRGFADFLGVEADEPVADGSSFPALYFGSKPSSFGGKSDDYTVREGNELIFTLNVVIDPAEHVFPPNALKFRCRTKYVGGLYMFFIDGWSNGYTISEGDDFSSIYELLYEATSQTLDTYKRL